MNTYCTTLLFFWEEKNRRITRYCVSKWIYANNPESVSYFTLQSKRTALSHFFSCVQHLQTLAKNVKRSFQCAQNDLVEGFHILFCKIQASFRNWANAAEKNFKCNWVTVICEQGECSDKHLCWQRLICEEQDYRNVGVYQGEDSRIYTYWPHHYVYLFNCLLMSNRQSQYQSAF